jgi:hypothetical protein
MKLVKTLGLILLFALLASTAAATTENKEMPTEKEVNAFIDGFKASGDFANSAYDAFIEQYPAGHCDLWSNGMISFYFYDPDSPKEYGSIYLSNGGKVSPGCNAGAAPVKSYTGEPEVKEEDKKVSEEKEEIEDEEGDNTVGTENTASAEYLINENGFFEGDADGDKLKIHNNRRALNPTYEGLMDFLKRNTIDERDYEYPTYTCGNFATDLHDAAEKEFIRAGIVVIRSEENDFAHTLNMFKTVDKGYIFIDCTSDGSKNGAEDFGDCIAEFSMDGYTITSIENPKLTTTRELPGETQFSYYW